MKYLIFNCAVFLALAYLIVGGDGSSLAHKAESNVEKRTEKVSLPLNEVPKAEAMKAVAAPATVQAPALPKAVEVEKTQVKKIPSRKSETLVVEMQKEQQDDPIPASIIKDTNVEPVENTKNHQNELRKMVADMEQMFVEKLIR